MRTRRTQLPNLRSLSLYRNTSNTRSTLKGEFEGEMTNKPTHSKRRIICHELKSMKRLSSSKEDVSYAGDGIPRILYMT